MLITEQGSYNIADIDGILYNWGSNDCGQLGIST